MTAPGTAAPGTAAPAPVASPSLAPAGSPRRAVRPLVWFALLAYGWTWGIAGAAFLLVRAGAVSESVVGLMDSAAGFGPAVAALAVAAALGRADLQALLASLVRWRVAPGWYLAALYSPALVAVAGAAAWFGPGALAYERLWPGIVTGYLPRFAVTLFTAGPIQEELGWRGFALPRLQPLLGSPGRTAPVIATQKGPTADARSDTTHHSPRDRTGSPAGGRPPRR